MKITTKGQYGLSLMIELAKNQEARPQSLKGIAKTLDMSDAYLEQIVTPLRNAKLVKSVRGAYGGYLLGKPAEEITAYEMLLALEGNLEFVEDEAVEDAGKRMLYDELQQAVEKVLHNTTLEDMKQRSIENGNSYMFYI